MEVDVAPLRRNGLAILWDVIVAPSAAFSALREKTHWLYAYLIASTLGTIGALLQVPAGKHVAAVMVAHQIATDPQMQAMTPEKQQQITAFAVATQQYAWVALPIIVIIAILVTAAVFTIVNAIGNGGSSFGRLLGLAANVSVIGYGIGYLLIGILAARVGPDAISSQRDLLSLLPSLAKLAPENAPKLAAFLAAINPFQIWSAILIVIGLRTMTKLAPAYIYATAIVVAFGSGVFAALAAR